MSEKLSLQLKQDANALFCTLGPSNEANHFMCSFEYGSIEN